MKIKLAPIFFALFFILTLFLGVETGESFFSRVISSAGVSASSSVEGDDEGRGEDEPFLLIIQVDDLTRDAPTLEGVWLLSYGNSNQELLFFPLMPSQAGDGLARDQALASSFSIDQEGGLSSDFLHVLETRNLAWSGVLVLDKIALGALVSSLGGVRVEETLFSPADVSSMWGDSQHTREEVRGVQAQLIAGVCARMEVLKGEVTLRYFFDQLPNHIRLEHMALGTLVRIWGPLTAGGDVSCRFPTLSP